MAPDPYLPGIPCTFSGEAEQAWNVFILRDDGPIDTMSNQACQTRYLLVTQRRDQKERG
jgi:hypothetical protein